MRRAIYAAAVLSCLCGLAGTLAAQDQPSPPPGTYGDREHNQQDRIANGVQSGQLTAGETKSLEGQEHALNTEARADRSVNGGTLTAADRTQLNQQQNQLSHNIYDDKHNATTAHYGNTAVGQRRENQALLVPCRNAHADIGEGPLQGFGK